jgi:sugar lactone lactonase YvrE
MAENAPEPVELDAEQVTDVCTEHGEGVVWEASTGLVRFVDLEAGALMTYDPGTGALQRRQLGKVVACVRPRRLGGLVVALERTLVLLDAEGTLEAEYGPAFDDEGIRFNDGGCDPAGRFWIGSMAYDETPGRGTIHRLDPDGSIHLVLTDVTISNGLAFTDDGRRARYVDTPTGRVDTLEVDPARGTVTGRRPFVEVTGGQPDGITTDAEGGVWVALWQGSAVHRYDRNGSLTHVVRLPASQVTCPAFGGPDLADLYVTTSRRGLPEGQEPAAGALFRVRPALSGVPVPPSPDRRPAHARHAPHPGRPLSGIGGLPGGDGHAQGG